MTFKELATYFKKLEETQSRNAMTEQLAELFKAARADEIGKICYLLQGRVVPLYEALEFGLADKFVIRAIARAYGVEIEEVTKTFKKLGDLGAAAEALRVQGTEGRDQGISVKEVYEKLYAIAQMNGEGSQEKKIESLSALLSSVDALSARYLVRIPLDKLRLGFSDMTILDALSYLLTGDKSLKAELEGSYNVRPDIGFLAETVKKEGMEGLAHVHMKVGAPILAALCQRLPTADDMIKKMGEVSVEPKYDGMRVQIHFKRSKFPDGLAVHSYSRNLENTTAMFPELQHIGDHVHGDEMVLDAEAIGVDAKGNIASFQETMTRKRKHDIESFAGNVPLKFFIFDVILNEGKELLSMHLKDRRKKLESIVKKGKLLDIAPHIVTTSPAEIREYHDKQLAAGLEGVVVKKWESPYEPGRRGYSWVKFKEEEGKTGKLTDTIDAVIMGYYAGEGKRAGFGIGMFLVGVRTHDQFMTVTKIGTGVSDELWKDLHKKLNSIKVKEKPKEYGEVAKTLIPDVWVAPEVVIEVAGDDLTRSPNHGAGYAVRFPRLVRLRTDRRPEDVTTLKEIEQMYTNQFAGKK